MPSGCFKTSSKRGYVRAVAIIFCVMHAYLGNILYFCRKFTVNRLFSEEALVFTVIMIAYKRRTTGLFSMFTSCISTTLVLLLLGTVISFSIVTYNYSRSLRENFAVEVMLSDTLNNRQLYAVQQQLRQMPCVRYTNYISKEKGTKELAEALNESPESFLGSSPVPAEFEAFLKADYANQDSLNIFLPRIKQMYGVTDLYYPELALSTVNYWIPLIGLILLVTALLLTFVSFSLINNTVRLNIYARRFSIHTMKLVGAKRSYIRRPFILRACLIGVVAALIADSIIGVGLYLFMNANIYLATLLTPIEAAIPLLSVLVCGMLLTTVCAFFSVNKYLRMRTSKIYVS